MAKAVVAAFRDAGFTDLTVVARNPTTGGALAAQYGYRWAAEDEGRPADVLVNVTPMGMQGDLADVLAFDEQRVAAASTVFDVVAFPSETPLIRLARSAGKQVLTGAEVFALQAAGQFRRYTGVTLTGDQIERASAFSRAS
jgi:shikimate dehydrogenase